MEVGREEVCMGIGDRDQNTLYGVIKELLVCIKCCSNSSRQKTWGASLRVWLLVCGRNFL